MRNFYANLMDKPYLLRPWEIERLTDKQIIELYYRKRDDKGVPISYESEEHEWDKRKYTSEKYRRRKEYEEFMKLGSVLGADTRKMREAFIAKHGDPYKED